MLETIELVHLLEDMEVVCMPTNMTRYFVQDDTACSNDV